MFLFGALLTEVITDSIKYTVGRLRPNFLSVCEPNHDLFNCSDGYIDWDVCTGDEEMIQGSRLSFISGHSSLSWYCAVFFVVYLQRQLVLSCFSTLLKPILQLCALMLALLTALSRVSDYKHHWSDVLAGSLVGATVALFTFYWLSGLLKTPDPRPSCPKTTVDNNGDGNDPQSMM
ncbi:phospholipid phosphatase 1-like [Glandiceps talaboti]